MEVHSTLIHCNDIGCTTMNLGKEHEMQVKTILNRFQKQRGFVYGTMQLEQIGKSLPWWWRWCYIGKCRPVVRSAAIGVPGMTGCRRDGLSSFPCGD